jgi:hypothetical protein
MSKLQEKLSVLLGAGDALLARLHKIKQACLVVDRRPTFLSDPASSRVVTSALKRFEKDGPDVGRAMRALELMLMIWD